MRLFISSLLTCLITATVHAEVVKSNEDGFIVKHTATISTDKARIFETMTGKVGQWWSPDHSFSGDAGNMLIDKQCFCERWGGSLVRHLNTDIWIENSKVVMTGGLGPLKELGLSGTMIWTLASTDEAGTMINWKYHVYGNSETDIPALATAVDGVLAEQIGRLMEYLNSGN